MQYECLEKLGEGAFGEALKARRRKVCRPDLSGICSLQRRLPNLTVYWPWMQHGQCMPALLALHQCGVPLLLPARCTC